VESIVRGQAENRTFSVFAFGKKMHRFIGGKKFGKGLSDKD
jgi:hypothetical protein